MAYLNDLEFLDVSNNKIEEIDIEDGLPSSLLFLKVKGNLFRTDTFDYRKEYVLLLENLIELDRIEVQPAERLSYQGILPRYNVTKALTDLAEKREREEAF